MSLSIRQHNSTMGSVVGNTIAISFNAPVPVNDTLVAFVFAQNDLHVTGVTDSSGNVWNRVQGARSISGTNNCDVWTATNVQAAAAGLAITATFNQGSGGGYLATIIYDLNGGAATGAATASSNGASVASLTGPTMTTAVSVDSFVLAGVIYGTSGGIAGTFSAPLATDEQPTVITFAEASGSVHIPNGGTATPIFTPSSSAQVAMSVVTIGQYAFGGGFHTSGFGARKPQAPIFKPFYRPK